MANAQDKRASETEFRISPATRPGCVTLTVADLERQIQFYEQVIGLELLSRDGNRASLGVGRAELLRFVEHPNARRYQGRTGLYHFALLLPNRRELARAIARLFSLRYPNHPTDHVMTQTTYLDDPEGNNIEIYADTPEEGHFGLENGALVARRANGAFSSGRDPLDIEALFRELTTQDRLDQPMPLDTTIGHVHLYVANLDASMKFYHELLGFDNMGIATQFRMGMVSAGGYHHHIGFNTWVGEGAPAPPSDALGLRTFTFELPDKGELQQVVERIRAADLCADPYDDGYLVRDPSKLGLLLRTKSGNS